MDKWPPFWQKLFEIQTKTFRFLMVQFSNGQDHSFSRSLNHWKPDHLKSEFQKVLANVSRIWMIGFEISTVFYGRETVSKPGSRFIRNKLCFLLLLLYKSGRTENGTNENNRTKKHVWCQNENYVGGATCWSSNWLYIDRQDSTDGKAAASYREDPGSNPVVSMKNMNFKPAWDYT